MSISSTSIRHPVFAWMLMSSLIIFGGISFTRMGISQLPDVDFPVVTVQLSMTGAAPEVMESDVIDPIENAVMSIQGVQEVTSSAKFGSATVTIKLDLDRNIDLAIQDVQAKVAAAQKKLPTEMDPPTISKTNPEDQPIMWVTLESDRHSMRDLMIYTRDNIQQHFLTVPDVGDLNLGGYVEPNLRVWVSEKSLNKYQLTVSDIIAAIQNEHTELPAGWIYQAKKEYNVRTMGEAESVAEFKKLAINSRGGAPNYTPIQLGQVATIEEGLADVRRISRGVGKPAVGLGIRKQRGSNAVSVAESVRAKITAIEKTLPPGMRLGLNFDSTVYIQESVRELYFTLLLSAFLTALVCWIFLGSWSSTINVLLSIPTSIVGTFTVLYFSGFTLNSFTLLGLSLAIGIVVDDAIMVLENIVRHKEQGKSKVQAALDGSQQITFAAIAATFSILAIFLPVAFMQGIIGKFFFQFGVTMSVAVLLSLVEALTLTPMRCAQFVEVSERTTRFGKAVDKIFHLAYRAYSATIGPALRWRWLVIISSLIIFSLSFFVMKKLNKEFIPPEDQSRFLMRVQTPLGSALDFTDQKIKIIEDFLAKRPEVQRYYVAVGGFGGGDVNSGIVMVTMKPKGQRGIAAEIGKEPSQQDFMQICRKTLGSITDIRLKMQDLSMRGFTASRGYPIEFTIQGPDWKKLGEYSKQIIKAMEATNLVTDMDSDYLDGMPEIQIIPNRDEAVKKGVNTAVIGQTINALIGGVVVGQYPRAGHRDDIRVKLLEDGKDRKEKIQSLYVRNNRGELIPLRTLVDIKETKSLSSINRKNRQRAVSVFSNIEKGKSQDEAIITIKKISGELLPPDYHVELTGGSQDFKNTFQSLMFALLLGIIVAYMVLASQFNSFMDPFSVLVALPFSISGAFFALYIGDQSLNMYSMIGLILLMGIVKKNSILLVDFTNQVRDEDQGSVIEALVKACPVRLRPILMTSFATVAGAIPAAMAYGPGAESRRPMAIAVIGGVIVSTVLTLYVVPCVYSLLSTKRRKIEV